MKTNKTRLTQILRESRAEGKIKLLDVAKAIGVSREEYFHMEKGRLQVNDEQLDSLALFYNNAEVFSHFKSNNFNS